MYNLQLAVLYAQCVSLVAAGLGIYLIGLAVVRALQCRHKGVSHLARPSIWIPESLLCSLEVHKAAISFGRSQNRASNCCLLLSKQGKALTSAAADSRLRKLRRLGVLV